MSIVPVESDRFSNMEKVADMRMIGKNDTYISKELGIPRKVVKELYEEYRMALSQDGEARDLARDHLFQMVKHYDSLIDKFYSLLDDIDDLNFNHLVAAQKNLALKAIADLDAKRLDALQKAGLLDSAELGDELIETQEKMELIIDILENELCAACKNKIAPKLQRLTGTVQEIIIVEQDG